MAPHDAIYETLNVGKTKDPVSSTNELQILKEIEKERNKE